MSRETYGVRIGHPLLKLPIRFCGETLAREVTRLPQTAWIDHPMKMVGNNAVPLVSPGGAITDEWTGPMGPTAWLRECPYVLQIMQHLDSTWGRSRFMGLAPGAVVSPHVDVHYYWRTHLRIHIPVITNPAVAFTCDDETVHMKPGECWILDSFFRHSVVNGGAHTRVHLVLDTAGSAHLWDLIASARQGSSDEQFVAPGEHSPGLISFEQVNSPPVMSPWEIRTHIAYMSDWTDEQPGRDEILAMLDRFAMAWSGVWARFGASEAGLPFYTQLLGEADKALAARNGPKVMMRNDVPLDNVIPRFILANAIAPAIMQRQQASKTVAAFRSTA